MVLALLGGCVESQPSQFQQDAQTRIAAFAESKRTCISELSVPELTAIRHKIEIGKGIGLSETPPSFEFASNDTFPTAVDLPLIAKWAAIRDRCVRRSEQLLEPVPSASPIQKAQLQKDSEFFRNVHARVGELIVALYHQKLTYGEFAQRRYWISSEGLAAERGYRESVLEKNQERQAEAEERFANRLATWAAYMQAVNARAPQTVYVHGTIAVQ
jgi:hypothetical protein